MLVRYGRWTQKYPRELTFTLFLQIWMLTGDKLETATCIAKSSHLVSRTQDIHIFRPVSIGPALLLDSSKRS